MSVFIMSVLHNDVAMMECSIRIAILYLRHMFERSHAKFCCGISSFDEFSYFEF